MCAIFGLGFMKNHRIKNDKLIRNFLRQLIVENKIRGMDATGLAYVSQSDINVIKKNVPGNVFINLREYDAAEKRHMTMSESRFDGILPPIAVIGHSRYKTKGSELNNVNNHPIVRNNVIGVHNGCLNNHDNLFNVYEKVFKRNGEVDSEIIFALIEYFAGKLKIHDAIDKATAAISGSLACAMVVRQQPHIVWLFRRQSPCDIIIYKRVGLLVWASNFRTIENAAIDYPDLGKGTRIDLIPNTGVGIDLHRNIVHKFGVSDYKQTAHLTAHNGIP